MDLAGRVGTYTQIDTILGWGCIDSRHARLGTTRHAIAVGRWQVGAHTHKGLDFYADRCNSNRQVTSRHAHSHGTWMDNTTHSTR